MADDERPQIDSAEKLHSFLTETIATNAFDEVEKAHPIQRFQPVRIDDEEAPVAPAPDKGADPPATAATSGTEPSPPDGQPAGQRKLLANKYENVDEFEKGYFELLNMNKRALQELDQLKSRPEPVREAPTARAETRQSAREVLKKLEDVGVDPDVVAEAMKLVAEETIDNRLRPRDALAAAESFMEANYPDAYRFGEEVGQYVMGDPQLRGFVQRAWERGEYRDAMEMAWLRYDMGRKVGAERHAIEQAAVTKAKIEEERKDAALITNQSAAVHAPKEAPMSRERMDKLVAASRGGYPEFLLRETIGKTLPDELFG